MIQFQPDDLVADSLKRCPAIAEVFLRFKTGCIGCSMATFCTLADVAKDYHLELSVLIDALNDTIQTPQPD